MSRTVHHRADDTSNVVPFRPRRPATAAAAKPPAAMTPAEKKALIRALIREISQSMGMESRL